MILHLVTKHRVSNSCLSIFERRAPGQNKILVLSSMPGSVISVNNGIVVTEKNENEIISSLDFYEIKQVVIHYLTSHIARFIHQYVPEGIPIYWWTYGGDLYHQFLERRGYNVFYIDLIPFRPGWLYMMYRFFQTHKKRILYRLKLLQGEEFMQTDLLDRIDGIIPCIPPDHEMACKYIKKNFKLVRVHPVGNPSFEDSFNNGNIVAVGHSASYTGNHLYALKFISKIDIKDSLISLTLSYSIVSKKYVEAVKKRYKTVFSNKVTFVEDYLSKEDYYKSLNNIKILIIPSWRQEALDNIFTCLRKGIKIFLSKKSPMFHYLIECGFVIFAIEDIDQHLFDTPLTIEEKLNNRDMLINYFEQRRNLIDEDFKLYFGDFNIDN